MLELGNSTPPADDLIQDVSEANFMEAVVDASQTIPVIVDFWAPWCGPCKTLGPALEAAVKEANGAVKMAKINVDENQMIAGQMRVQSIPTVYAFYQGQPIDGFQGALPGSEIKAFVDRVIEAAGGSVDGGLSDAIEAAEQMLQEGAAADAVETFAAILGEDGMNVAAYSGLARAYMALEDLACLRTSRKRPKLMRHMRNWRLHGRQKMRGHWVNCWPLSKRMQTITRPVSTMPKRCTRQVKWKRQSNNCCSCFNVTVNGMRVLHDHSYS